jgi:hypothetical protein
VSSYTADPATGNMVAVAVIGWLPLGVVRVRDADGVEWVADGQYVWGGEGLVCVLCGSAVLDAPADPDWPTCGRACCAEAEGAPLPMRPALWDPAEAEVGNSAPAPAPQEEEGRRPRPGPPCSPKTDLARRQGGQ